MISAKIILDTVSKTGARITTMQLEMPRFILAQFNTHRVFSRNASSSRAIPTQKLRDRIKKDPVIPVHWGLNRAGMVAYSEVPLPDKVEAKKVWLKAAEDALRAAKTLQNLGVHKQVANRLLEPFMWTSVVVTSTDWDNFFKLRLAEDTQPEFQALAKKMKDALDYSIPTQSEYHLPYVSQSELPNEVTQEVYEEWANISAARCARVSYLNHDGSAPDVVKDKELATMLWKHQHCSPFEHQAFSNTHAYTEMEIEDVGFTPALIEPSLVKFDNLHGWISFRHHKTLNDI